MITACPPIGTPKRPFDCKRREARALQARWIEQLAFGEQRDQDELVQLWLGIFPVSWRQLNDMRMLERQILAIRESLQGSYTDLLGAMVQDAALQISLNGLSNHRGKPNENLARELLELFSLGEGNYAERDVIEAARALTGYRMGKDGRLFIDTRRHDDSAKTILGKTERFNGASLVGWLCQQPSTAHNIVKRLWPRVVGSLPSPQRLQTLSLAWFREGLSLPWLMRELRRSPEAIAGGGQRLDDPIKVVTRSLALLGSRHPDAFSISQMHLSRMGQEPFDPPSVKGWPVNEEWINLRWLQARRRGLQALLADEEVWASRRLPQVLSPSIAPIPPLTMELPAPASRESLGLLFTDPVWQLA
ncbi:DUF1800 family protein [Synechococcus sp. CBW1107]|uniref:DUF1800 family protein n=1 Tax=Synechococcus sp. CBW1107 TaxID=2789857 RepID=UPI002AD2A1DA|nr:DUF1800 family protein [Synechococcus sp. CBW1107]